MRKHILLKNEIDSLIYNLVNASMFTNEYTDNLIKRLEELKEEWYKIKKRKKNGSNK